MTTPAPIPQTYGVQVEFDVPTTMRDGTVLRANIYRPVGDGAFPVLLTRSPYGKDLPLTATALSFEQAARRGYIVVVQDTRGRFTSEGEWLPFLHERDDGYDSVEWAASLPGSDGNVGMFGGSYVGFTQWAAARAHPPHLKALFPLVTWDHPFNGVFSRGGANELGLPRNWFLNMALDNALRRTRGSGDPRQIMSALAQIAADLDSLPEKGYADLPFNGFGQRLGLPDFDLPDSVAGRYADVAWHDRVAVDGDYDGLALPVFHMGGWYDIFLGGTLRNYTELAKRGRAPQKLLIGPWSHANQSERVGEISFGYASQAAFMNLQADLYSVELRWFDRFLKGVANGIDQEPSVQIFVMGINQWRTESSWPLARAVPTRWYLHSQGNANGLVGDGTFSTQAPQDEPPDQYAYDPLNPAPTVGGALLIHPLWQSGPFDQRPVEQRNDVLVFTSEPLSEALEVTGPIAVTLFAASDRPDTDFVARLVDVHPSGFAQNLCDGIVRARYRHGMAREELLDPGEITEFTIDLWATSNVFLPGHRIRLDITSSNFPRWDRNLNVAEPPSVASAPVTAHQTIVHDRRYPSHVTLPVVPA
jgi:putative CocE/NonD family hydrolase